MKKELKVNEPVTNNSFAHWYAAGVLSGIRRVLETDVAPESEYFAGFAKELLESDNPKMPTVLETLNEGYWSLPLKQRVFFTGDFANVDVQASPKLGQIQEPLHSLIGILPFFEFGPFVPGLGTETPKGIIPSGIFSGLLGIACCQKLELSLEYIEVFEETWDPGKDNIGVTGITHGTVMQPSPTPFAWPLKADGTIGEWDLSTGENVAPEKKMAVVTPGQNCVISVSTTISFWEQDLDSIDKFLREATNDLIKALAAKAGVVSVPASVSGLIQSIIDALLDAFDLKDDKMGEINLDIGGRLIGGGNIKDRLTWSPNWREMTAANKKDGRTWHESVNDDTARVGKYFKQNDGEWLAQVIVKRTCQ